MTGTEHKEKAMNADAHTKEWFYGGGTWHLLAGTYLGYRECGCGRFVSACSTLGLAVLLAWDWVRR